MSYEMIYDAFDKFDYDRMYGWTNRESLEMYEDFEQVELDLLELYLIDIDNSDDNSEIKEKIMDEIVYIDNLINGLRVKEEPILQKERELLEQEYKKRNDVRFYYGD